MVAKQPSRILFALLAVVVIAAAGIGAALLYEHNKSPAPVPVLTVQVGDNVTVNYIGEFGSGPQTGRVFDTSVYSVATNNASYPKSLEYESRGARSAYSPLPVSVGPNVPSSGYTIGNLTFGSVVTGFWQGLLGLRTNVSGTIVVPPSLGYGPINASCVGSAPMVYSVPVLTNVPITEFSTEYPNASMTVGAEFTDPTYGWLDTVLAVNATTVVVTASPTVGSTASPNGLPFTVANVSSTTITLSSQLTPASAGLVLGHVKSGGLCGKSQFIVNSVDPATGTYTENYNPEVQGETLTFIVTVVTILPP